jgi:Leucine-rich repeat (LRR) protein
MDDIMKQIDELKQMQKFPKFYLSKYFDDLKNEIDLKYAVKQDEQVKYIEIIKNIELFEQDAYKKSQSFNTFDKEIKLIEDKLNDSNLTELAQLIDELKYKIEKILFSNKSIFFYDIVYNDYSFLIIINDEYIRKNNCVEYYYMLKLLTKNKLNGWISNNIIERTPNKNSINVLNISIAAEEDINLASYSCVSNFIKEIHENTLNDLSNLKSLEFNRNLIDEINPNLFRGLFNLMSIDFSENQIEVIHEDTFNGLTNLKKIYFCENKIKEINPNVFNGLTNLENIDFSGNKIEEIHENTFNGLTSLKTVDFSYNQIKEIHPKLLNRLASLEIIVFTGNKIEVIHENTFNGLTNLKKIDFNFNQIKEKHLNLLSSQLQTQTNFRKSFCCYL